MQGLEISKKFFEECGYPVLKEQFPDVLKYLCVGLIGSGSECLGYDDEVSMDHDFEPGFCIFLPDEDVVDRKVEFKLERAYAKLPREFLGFKRSLVSPVGGSRHGVKRISDFILEKTGTKNGNLNNYQWLNIPEQSLLECTNGEIYFDNYGEMNKIRDNLKYYPEDIRKKKIAGNMLIMAQSGLYNYLRTIKHKEYFAAQLAVYEFVKSTMNVIFLLNKQYMPYYKWSFRCMRSLDILPEKADLLNYLMTTNNTDDYTTKSFSMEQIALDVIYEAKLQGLSKADCLDLENHAYSINDSIEDGELRNMHILSSIR